MEGFSAAIFGRFSVPFLAKEVSSLKELPSKVYRTNIAGILKARDIVSMDALLPEPICICSQP